MDKASPGPEAGGEAGMSRTAPQSIQDLGLPSLFLGQLTLKHCFYMDFFTLGELAERLKVSDSIISEVLEYLKKAKWIEVRGPDPMNPVATSRVESGRPLATSASVVRSIKLAT